MLYPKYDREAHVLEVESRVARPWPYGIDIDGTIIFDVDSDGVLGNFDLLIPKKLWKSSKELLARPDTTRRAGLAFTEETLKHKSFHLPLEVKSNSRRSRALIRFGTKSCATEGIQLSGKCVALVCGDELVGFWVDMS
jgi:hypothetical protein